MSLPNLQGLIKYRYSMQALKTMGYAVVSFGEYEASLPLVEAFAAWAIQDNVPRFVSANLVEPNFKEFVHPWHVASTPDSKVSVGVTAVVVPDGDGSDHQGGPGGAIRGHGQEPAGRSQGNGGQEGGPAGGALPRLDAHGGAGVQGGRGAGPGKSIPRGGPDPVPERVRPPRRGADRGETRGRPANHARQPWAQEQVCRRGRHFPHGQQRHAVGSAHTNSRR